MKVKYAYSCDKLPLTEGGVYEVIAIQNGFYLINSKELGEGGPCLELYDPARFKIVSGSPEEYPEASLAPELLLDTEHIMTEEEIIGIMEKSSYRKVEILQKNGTRVTGNVDFYEADADHFTEEILSSYLCISTDEGGIVVSAPEILYIKIK